jgi:outer membrane protein OmpA-like peptidoglycan-associated protein
MIKYISTLLFLLFINNLITGQNKYFKLIEKKKYEKAEKKFTEELVENPEDIGLNYAMSILLIKKDFSGFDPKKAYSYLTKSKDLYSTITDESEIKELNEIPINNTVFQYYTDTICRYALNEAVTANNIDSYNNYLNYYKASPANYKQKAIENRDILAYKLVTDSNTIESYQLFMTKYPNAAQFKDARSKRNKLAFAKAQSVNNINSYQEFINKYPEAEEVTLANASISELAYAYAEKINTALSYKKFIDEYPQSVQYTKAVKRYEEKQFIENTIIGDWLSYKIFINNNPQSSWVSIAQDSIYKIGVKTKNLKVLEYCANNFTGSKKNKALLLYHDVYTNDGEIITLDAFYNKYLYNEDADIDILSEIKTKDYEIANLGDKLFLYLPYSSKDYVKYDEYIRIAAPNDKAYVTLQRIISQDIASKNWLSAINKVKKYLNFFDSNNKEIINLISILETKWDNSIKINSVGNGINTINGGEYVPVISADDKFLYFCGKGRKDNIGGEDIFVSKKTKGVWGTSKIVTDLSSIYENDAPLSVSADGTKILLFKSGKLYYADKTNEGWSDASMFPEQINSGKWQADAMISSDGKALLFASTKEGGFNLYDESSAYHGDYLYPSDIYVSLLDENNEWGEPINLGPIINTKYCDRMPFLHPDMKTLYFSSDGHGGLGKLDVYKATRLSDTCWNCWSEPVNMGKEINTEESDWGYKISTDGERAYFSKKNSAKENEDIYWLNLPKHLRPDLVATISGTLVDKNNEPVSAEIHWEDLETGKDIGQSKSDPSDGSFFIVLPLGKIYGYYVDNKEYFPVSNNIDLRHNNKPVQIEENIDLVTFKQMVEDGTAVPVNNLFFNFSENSLLPYSLPELKRVAVIIKSNNLKVEISGHTDNVGDDKKNQILSEQRALAVKEYLVKEGCLPDNLIVVGYGKTKPIASNESEAGRAKNRRVELRFIK